MMIMKQNKGILFVAHGSPNKEANDFIIDLAHQLADESKMAITPAFLNGNPVSIEEGFKNLVKKGLNKIDIFPYFLTPGGHTQRDIPALVENLKIQYPSIQINLLEPIGLQKPILEFILKCF
ncbi:MAG: cobalamin (vitamin B12) biosynthesis CbiX protein [uncultured bacterium]|nr:MAG: cobalamin (vitamin B12) biosynthesis CbiX protein [uncultured bacterium]